MPKLPDEIQELFQKELGLSEYDASEITANSDVTKYFLALVDSKVSPKLSANWILGNLYSRLNEEGIDINKSPIDTKRLAELIKRIEDSTISNNAAKKVFDFIWDKSSVTVDQAIDELGLKQISDSSEIDLLIDEVLKNNQQMIEEYLSGKEKAFNALVGQIMKASKGKANPSQVNQILKQKIAK
jgi:aspartyl-tRNA(Asn)/glutamyl-tRNA(Gln) amidotransferase subunit B